MRDANFYRELAEIRRQADERWQLLVATAAGRSDAAGGSGNGNGHATKAVIALAVVVVTGLAGYTTIIGVTTKESGASLSNWLKTHTSEKGHSGEIEAMAHLKEKFTEVETQFKWLREVTSKDSAGLREAMLKDSERFRERLEGLESGIADAIAQAVSDRVRSDEKLNQLIKQVNNLERGENNAKAKP